jgi:hypothetical protein
MARSSDMGRLFKGLCRRRPNHRAVFSAFAEGLARMIGPRREAARAAFSERELGEGARSADEGCAA